MIETRSHSASASDRMWLDNNTVRPSVRSAWMSAELLFHQRVEPGRWLVEQQQLDVGGERGDERHLLPVAFGVGAALLGRVELEPFEQVISTSVIKPTPQPAEEVDDLTAGQLGPQRDIARDVGETTVQLGAVSPRIPTEHRHRAAVGPQHAEKYPDGGRLPRSVRAQEAVHLPAADLEVEPIERHGSSEVLLQASNFDRRCHGGPLRGGHGPLINRAGRTELAGHVAWSG